MSSCACVCVWESSTGVLDLLAGRFGGEGTVVVAADVFSRRTTCVDRVRRLLWWLVCLVGARLTGVRLRVSILLVCLVVVVRGCLLLLQERLCRTSDLRCRKTGDGLLLSIICGEC